MKFAGVIALFVAAAVAAPTMGGSPDDVVNSASEVVNDPSKAAAEAEASANGFFSALEAAANKMAGNVEGMFNSLLSSASSQPGDLGGAQQ